MIIQHHDSVVTSSDLGLALHCQYDLGNKSVGINSHFQQYGRCQKLKCQLTMSYQVTNELDLEVQGEISPALIEQGTVESPTVVMSVTARWGPQSSHQTSTWIKGGKGQFSDTQIRMSKGIESLTRHIIAGEAVELREPKLATLLSSTLQSSILSRPTRYLSGSSLQRYLMKNQIHI